MLTVKVTQEHILGAKGVMNPRSGGFNPVAKAVCAALGVTEGRVRVELGEIEHIGVQSVALPDDVAERLRRWDETLEMDPFSFTIEGLEETSKPS